MGPSFHRPRAASRHRRNPPATPPPSRPAILGLPVDSWRLTAARRVRSRFVCRCAFGWVGLRCQTEVNPCALGSLIERQGQLSVHAYAPHDCDPDFAACVQTSPGEYRCDCTAGYETVTVGRSCTDIDECASSPCEVNSPAALPPSQFLLGPWRLGRRREIVCTDNTARVANLPERQHLH